MNTIQHRKLRVNAYKVSNGCSICGYNRHPSALCFDHLPQYDKHDQCKSGSKAGGMYMLYRKKHSVAELITEIRKCRILCHNCHMEKTHHKIKSVNPSLFQRCCRAISSYNFLTTGMSIETLRSKLEKDND
jgi:hypothetical protein